MILLIDNEDSFTFNLCRALAGLGAEIVVQGSDALDTACLLALRPVAIVLSPGPGCLEAAGVGPASLRARGEKLPAELELCACTDDGIVMGVRNTRLPRHGVQFHPESILSPDGVRLLAVFLDLARDGATPHAQ